MFGKLKEATNESKPGATISGNKLYITKEDNKNKIEFDKDFIELERKIFIWLMSPERYLELTKNESELFRNCSHAAYYYLTESQTETQLKTNIFIHYYKESFIK
jgi:hypothetical protein